MPGKQTQSTPEWAFVAGALQRGTCVLCLGPQAFQASPGLPLAKQVARDLGMGKDPHPEVERYFSDDGLLRFHPGPARFHFANRLAERYLRLEEQQEQAWLLRPEGLLRKIVHLPVSLIVHLGHHRLLRRAFTLEGLACGYDYYHKGREHLPFVDPSPDHPLLYNLLGDVGDPDSLVLTHRDLCDFLKSFFEGKTMAPELKALIHHAEVLLCLGNPSDQGYYQLYVEILQALTSRSPAALVLVPGYEAAQTWVEALTRDGPRPTADQPHRRTIMLEELGLAKGYFQQDRFQKGLEALWPIVEHDEGLPQALVQNLIQQQGAFHRLSQALERGDADPTARGALARVKYRLVELLDQVEKAVAL